MIEHITEIPYTSLESFAHLRGARMREARVQTFDAAVRACVAGGMRAGEQVLESAWERDPERSTDEDAAARTRLLNMLRWMAHDEGVHESDTLACQPFALERVLSTGGRYVLHGRLDALSRERRTLYVWTSNDPQGALLPAAYALQLLCGTQVRVNRVFFDAAAAYPVVAGDVTAGEVESQMREIDRLAEQWIAQFDQSRPTLSLSRTAERCRSIFQGWGPHLD
ncbi:hypothetical protein EPN52_03515 [bacterium]|nr:MAG: hypothetical protein EPN52_03515 [bacterium]